MKLWLDDIRDPLHYVKDREEWVWVKTASEAIERFKLGDITEASLDHDLGLPSCAPCRRAAKTPEEYSKILQLGCWHGQQTGYAVVCWLETHPDFWPINGVKVHSSNPAGRQRMQQVIDKHYLEGR